MDFFVVRFLTTNLYVSVSFGCFHSLTRHRLKVHTAAAERQLRTLKTLDGHLATRTFFVGERITLADIAVATIVQQAVSVTIDAPLRAQLPHVIRHLETVVNQPKFAGIFEPTNYVEKALQYTPPPKEKKDPKPAAPPAPKAEKKPKKEDDDEEEEDPSIKEPPKARSPLEDLPKSNFNLEDWKRAYSNKDTRGADGALEWFYQKYVYFPSSQHSLTLIMQLR